MMGRMIVGDVSLRNVSGPVTIADYAGRTARIGFAAYIGFLALISVSIGVLNLLPIPMLDGGHLMYYIIEAVRGRPIPEKWHENGQRIGLGRSEERRVGKECVSTCRSRWLPDH